MTFKFFEYDTGIPMYVLVGEVLFLLLSVFYLLLRHPLKDNYRGFFIILLIEYVTLVLSTTVFYREVEEYRKVKIMPFWSYMELNENNMGLSDNLLNTILFIPFGFLIRGILKDVGCLKICFIGVCFSVAIELLQLVFMKGFCEFDDIFHNTLGCMLGCFLFSLFLKVKNAIME